MKSLLGTGVALVTPFNKDQSIDFNGLEKLVEFNIAGGVDYLVVQGTTGESPSTSAEEKKLILERVILINNGRRPIIFGIGGNNTNEILKAFDYYDLSRVDAILSVSPYYNKPTQEGIYQHYKMIAAASPVPVILYNVPGRTASNISAETTLKLAKIENIVAVKEASGNIEQCMQIARNKPNDFLLISGDDLLTPSIFAMGGSGVISVLANGFPAIFNEMCKAGLAGDFISCSKQAFRLLDINPYMYSESNPVGIKHVLKELGICDHYVRLPLLPPSQGLQEKIRKIMNQMD